jgi:hypothetical protein
MSAATDAKALCDHLFRAAMSREHAHCGGDVVCMWCVDEEGRASLRREGFDPDKPSNPDPFTMRDVGAKPC